MRRVDEINAHVADKINKVSNRLLVPGIVGPDSIKDVYDDFPEFARGIYDKITILEETSVPLMKL